MAEDPVTEGRRVIERSRRELIEQMQDLIDKGQAQADRVDNALLTLNAGALLLSITFVGTLTTSKQCLWLLFVAWGAFIVSMICVIFAMLRAQRQSHQSAVETANNLERFSQMDFVQAAQQRVTFPIETHKTVVLLNTLAFIGFVVGVAFLCAFVAINLSRDKARATTARSTSLPSDAGNRVPLRYATQPAVAYPILVGLTAYLA